MEGDIKGFRKKVIVYQISIHALRVEGDRAPLRDCFNGVISIHALRVEGDAGNFGQAMEGLISIHALRVEGDAQCGKTIRDDKKFLSTPSGWRATPNDL